MSEGWAFLVVLICFGVLGTIAILGCELLVDYMGWPAWMAPFLFHCCVTAFYIVCAILWLALGEMAGYLINGLLALFWGLVAYFEWRRNRPKRRKSPERSWHKVVVVRGHKLAIEDR